MSNRLTFSLASLILLFGLVFVPVTVMAHEVTTQNNGDGQVHNTDTPVKSEDAAGDTNHGAHPSVTAITLKAGDNVRGTMAAVAADDGKEDTDEVQTFTIVIDFDQDVTNAATSTNFSTLPEIGLTAASDVIDVKSAVQDGTATVAAVSRVAGDNSKFEAVVTIATNFPSGKDDEDDETLTFRVFVPARSVFSLQTVPEPGNNKPGGPNYKSGTYEFTLVKELDADETAPTVMISSIPASGTALPTADDMMTGAKEDKVVFVFEFSEGLGTTDGNNLQVTDLVISGASTPADDDLMMSTLVADIGKPIYHLALTPAEDATEVKVTLLQGSVGDTSGNVLAASASHTYATPDDPGGDNTPPTVTITPPTEPEDNGSLVFKISFDEALGLGANDLVVGDLTIKGAREEPTPTLSAVMADNTYELTVMPETNKTVTVSLDAGTVGDVAGNRLDVPGDGAMATFDGTAPTVTITAPDAPDTDGNLEFTFVFSESIMGFDSNAIRGSGFSLIATVPMKMEPSGTETTETWTVKVTPDAANTTVKVALNAGAVKDMNGNALAAGMTATYTPDMPAAPDLTATKGQEKVTLKWTVAEGASYEYRKKSGTATFKEDDSDYMPIAAADLKAVTGSTTMKMFEVTGLTGGTKYTFQVRVKASGDIPAGTHKEVTATPTAAPTLVSTGKDLNHTLEGLSVPAESYVLLVRDGDVEGLPASVTAAQKIVWAEMPDLQALLYGGGSIQLSRNKTPQLDHDADAKTDKRDAAVRDLILTEVMWARNTALIGMDGELDHQWIEIYNPLKVAVGGVTVETKAKRPTPSTADPVVQLDMLSNQVGNGWALTGLGQDGSIDGKAETDDVNFVSMYRNNRAGDKHGWVKGHWSPSTEIAVTGHLGTPGRGETKQGLVVVATPVPRSPFVINEFGIGTSDGQDWIELRNVTASEQTLKNLLLTSVEKVDEEKIVFHFHDQDWKVPAGDVVLIVSTDPVNTGIAAGVNLASAKDEQVKKGVTSIYAVKSFELPADKKFNLILRKDYDNKSGDWIPGKKLDKVVDAIGSLKVDKDTADFNTDFWPLKGAGAPHGDVIEGLGQDFKAGTVYIRKNAEGGTGEHHLGKVSYTGIGYDRVALKSDANGGTPGYDNGAVKEKIAELTTGDITISEVMFDTGAARQNLAQWIELYNSSMTQSVNLNGWKLHIENAAKENGELETNTFSATLSLDTMTISPNQTVLIVSTTGRNSDRDHFPSSRVVNTWTTKKHRDALEMARPGDAILSTVGFHIKLTDKDNGTVVDEVGNLDGNRRTRDNPEWALPMGEDDGRRSSIIRVYDEGIALKGTMEDAWISADATNLAYAISHTFYGEADDFGTPGFRGGGPVPVSLSKFRPERLDDGTIVVRWITESELNNAGFNILRSDTRNGQFAQINTSLIKGQGTTSERTTYAFPDTSAKPNVVYYYQIQDVSLDGNVTTLRQSRLKGDISAAGKLTTTWGELKALQ